MTRSAEELEREVEQTRSRVDHTADAIGDRMSPGQLMDEVMRSLRGSGGSDMLANLGRQVRDNPLPLAMVGAGLAWLMMGSGTRHSEGRYEGSYEGYGAYPGGVAQPGEDYYSMPEGGTGGAGGSSTTGRAKAHASDMASRAAGAARSAADSVAGAASSLGDAVSGAASGAGHAAHGAAHSVRHAGGRAGAGMSHAGHYGSRLQRSFLDVIEQEPLVVGALGVAVGAAIGAALPSTRIEDRYLGPARDSALEEGQEMVRERVEDAKDVAAAAYEGAREEADRQGLTSTGTDTLADKAERVAQAGSEAAKEEADKKSGPAG